MLRILILLGTVLSLMGCSLANQIRLRNSNDHLEPQWPAATKQVNLGTHYLGEKPYVDVTLNGVPGFKFLIDTGASITIVMDTPKVLALNLERGYDLALGGWVGEGKSPAFQTSAKTLSLSGVGFEVVNLAFIPSTTTKYFLDPTEAVYDGVLGHDVLHHFSWIFDKQENRIAISREAYVEPKNATVIEFDTFFSKIDIAGKIDFGNGQVIDHEIIIDTGSRHYLKVASELIEGEDIELPGKTITAVDFGLSGRAVHQRVTLPELELGNLKLKKIKTNIIGDGLEDDFSVIGSALLNQYVSVIDYHSDKMYLIPYPNASFKTKYNLLGLELRKLTSGDFIVRYVFPELVSTNYDFKEGDLITSINGKLSSKISLSDWLNISAKQGEYKLCRMRQQEQCFLVESKPVEGYSSSVE